MIVPKGLRAGRYAVKEFALENIMVEHANGLDAVTRAIFEAETEFTSLSALTCSEPAGLGSYVASIFGYIFNRSSKRNPSSLDKAIEKYSDFLVDCNQWTTVERNKCLATLVREVCNTQGWLAGWICLSEAAPRCGLHTSLMEDLATCVDVYSRIHVAEKRDKPVNDIRITVVSPQNTDSLFEIGPKSLGGRAWKVDPDYEAVKERWTSPGFARLPPVVAFGWNAINKKVVSRQDEKTVIAMSMLGTIDYDLDQDDANKAGFANIMKEIGPDVAAVGEQIQGGVLVGMLNFDLQSSNRSEQVKWLKASAGSFVIGSADLSPKEVTNIFRCLFPLIPRSKWSGGSFANLFKWITALVLDNAILPGFGYEGEARYSLSTKGMFLGTLVGNTYDTLFDRGCASRVSSGLYAYGSGVHREEIHRPTAGFAIGTFDAIARRIQKVPETDLPLMGDGMALHAGAWSPFNGRYRTWERFVKYTRQLQRSKAPESKAIFEVAKHPLVLPDDDIDGSVATSWSKAMSPEASSKLTERTTKPYTPLPSQEVLTVPGVTLPNLCHSCDISFKAAALNANDEIQAVADLPKNVVSSPAVSLAAAIRRTAVWATTNDCCDVCACRIGSWGDNASNRVLILAMVNEPEMSAKEWLLQSYFISCVAFWPVSVPSILLGFDLVADLQFADKAMGDRDVVDC
ncbi:hypothetical protein G7Y89_g12107 [Cudoniella acicularis]|uniref:Uncharacterized protein n=1 Tax=Cudoniella acicularis TaxID=354080 RepID=A0A8H4VXN8_9HELO|nr:hypothetical protein G7Y89_g12107 [Cudoniella acicularis]